MHLACRIILGILIGVIARPASAQGEYPALLPLLSEVPEKACVWPKPGNAEASRVSMDVVQGTWELPSKWRLVEDSASRTPNYHMWVSSDGSSWLRIERGTTAQLAGSFGLWSVLVTAFYFENDSTAVISIGCSHCMDIAQRCHETVNGRPTYVAWRGNEGDDQRATAYSAFAAIGLGGDDWLGIWGGGKQPEAARQMITIIRSVQF